MQNINRSFDAMPVSGLSDEARETVSSALGAMRAWRDEIVVSSEKNIDQVIGKMSTAARVLGWPDQIVAATRTHMQRSAEFQIQVMDQIMDSWKQQARSPNPSAMLSALKSLPGFTPAVTDVNAFFVTALNPFRTYLQLVEHWQRAWASAAGPWR